MPQHNTQLDVWAGNSESLNNYVQILSHLSSKEIIGTHRLFCSSHRTVQVYNQGKDFHSPNYANAQSLLACGGVTSHAATQMYKTCKPLNHQEIPFKNTGQETNLKLRRFTPLKSKNTRAKSLEPELF